MGLVILIVVLALVPAPQPPQRDIVRINTTLLRPSSTGAPSGGASGAAPPATPQPTPQPTPRPTPQPTAVLEPTVRATPVAPTPEATAARTPQPEIKKVIHREPDLADPTPEPILPMKKARSPKQDLLKKTERDNVEIVEAMETPAPPPPHIDTSSRSFKRKLDEPVALVDPTPVPTPSAETPPEPTPTPSAAMPETPPAIHPDLLEPARGPSDRPTGQATGPVQIVEPGAGTASGGGGGDNSNLVHTYYAICERKLMQNFSIPYAAPERSCYIQFTIQRDGTITDIKRVQTSGAAHLDQAALNAVRKTERLPPIYDGIRQNVLTPIIQFNFDRDE